MSTQILLIRHGETFWNREERIQGHRDVPLSPLGEEQARKLGKRLRQIPLAAAYSSDSARALRTAQIALEGLDLPLEVTPILRERNFGAWEGLLWTEIQTKFPEESRRFHADSVGFAAENGETWTRMQGRVFEKVRLIADDHPGQNVAVFTHGGPCKAAVLTALGLPAVQWRIWVASNASIHRLIHESDRSGRGLWKLAGFNDISHLDEADLMADPSAARLKQAQEA